MSGFCWNFRHFWLLELKHRYKALFENLHIQLLLIFFCIEHYDQTRYIRSTEQQVCSSSSRWWLWRHYAIQPNISTILLVITLLVNLLTSISDLMLWQEVLYLCTESIIKTNLLSIYYYDFVILLILYIS